MTRLAICLLLLATLGGCIEQPGHLEVKEDKTRAVTCWQSDSGMACLPNWMLAPPEPEKCLINDLGKSEACRKLFRENAGNQRQLSPHEQEDNGPTPARAQGRWIDERYQL
ncbi:hypothetical protein [Pseudomonas sp. RW3S2]|uniref:hypothetical protein n=1 Tax=Pseudomonas sp. RW3S2 TaxID=485884 RepID=UPI0016456F27|nr:hypothetical protein [Pseudomonas sp. RW3S2]MBC3423677.1 hypothetical protein [Pseudomonas sp. RW3S2]